MLVQGSWQVVNVKVQCSSWAVFSGGSEGGSVEETVLLLPSGASATCSLSSRGFFTDPSKYHVRTTLVGPDPQDLRMLPACPASLPAYWLPWLWPECGRDAVETQPLPLGCGWGSFPRKNFPRATRPLVPQYFLSFPFLSVPRKSSQKTSARTTVLLSFLFKSTTPRAP